MRLVRSMDPTDVVIVYAEMPMPLSKAIVCVVLALAVTVNTDNIPVVAACFKVT